ncbi:MAG: hypothetical protein RSB38_07100, partial [Oscillospiraceae bacterium]
MKKAIIVDKNLDNAIFSTLLSNNYSIIKSFDMDILYKPVNTHPDMQIHFVADDYAICEPNCYEYYKKELPSHIKLKAGNKISKGTYPYDIA